MTKDCTQPLSLKFGQIRQLTVELAALERLKKKIPYTDNGRSVMATLASSILVAGKKDNHKFWTKFEFQPEL